VRLNYISLPFSHKNTYFCAIALISDYSLIRSGEVEQNFNIYKSTSVYYSRALYLFRQLLHISYEITVVVPSVRFTRTFSESTSISETRVPLAWLRSLWLLCTIYFIAQLITESAGEPPNGSWPRPWATEF